MAILTGDALLTHAFQILSKIKPPQKAGLLLQELADAAGTRGMIGGQVEDILLSGNGSPHMSVSTLESINRRKTGRLIEASAVLGALVGTTSKAKIKKIRQFGASLGLAFQVVDDIMDGDGYLQLMSRDEALAKAGDLIQKAKHEAAGFGKKAGRLVGLADFLLGTIYDTPVDLKN